MTKIEQRAHEIIAILKAATAKLIELDKKHAEATAKQSKIAA